MVRLVGVVVAGVLLLGGCASRSDEITAQYVSPLQYASLNCDQLGREGVRIAARVVEVSGMQDDAADRDAIATGLGVVLFWPALFFLAGDDHAHELGRLKGEYEAVERAAIQKDCQIADDIRLAREMAEARAAEQEAETLAKRTDGFGRD